MFRVKGYVEQSVCQKITLRLETFRNTSDFAGSFLKLRLHDAIYRLRFYSNSLIHILSLSNSHNNVASVQKNRGDKSHRVIVALSSHLLSHVMRLHSAIRSQNRGQNVSQSDHICISKVHLKMFAEQGFCL